LCSRAYILAGGKIIAAGQPDEVIADDRVKQVYLGENFSF
jgi:lipopolysaccharide export system ATP-binding protein